MEKEEIYERIRKLRKLVEYHRTRYHTFDSPEISDEAFDALRRELEALEREYPECADGISPAEMVGGETLDRFEKVPHETPMLSLNDAFSEEEVKEWFDRVDAYLRSHDMSLASASFYCELKIDGLAIELIYEKGALVRGVTRGDGFVGEDITQNVKMVSNIPHILERLGTFPVPERLVVRGEIFITKEGFERINAEQRKEGMRPYANARNLAAGSLRQLDPTAVAKRKLDSFQYDIVFASDLSFKTHEDKHLALASWGFSVNQENRKVRSLKEVYAFRDRWNKARERLPYEVDGIVVIINENHLFEAAGTVGKAPRGAIAYKFSPKEAITRIKNIRVQVGRTGVLTPVAELVPVSVGGVTISRATLHNEDEIRRLGMKIGDTVVVSRAGDVIPKILRVIPELRTGKEKKFRMPKTCPVDGSPVVYDGAFAKCSNEKCGARNREAFRHFVSRGALDIRGLGPKVIDRFLDEGLVSDASDIFFMSEGDIETLERFGKKSAENLVREIESKKKTSVERLMFGLGIPHVGEETAYVLAKLAERDAAILEKPSDLWDFFSKFSRESFEAIRDIGPKVSESISEWFARGERKAFLKRLDDAGVRFLKDIKGNVSLYGKSFVLTGALSSMERAEAKKKIRAHGGEVSETVSKKTSFVVAGDHPGSKISRAKKLGIPVISEEEFLGMIGEK